MPKLFGSVNPFEWMEMQALSGKTNFFGEPRWLAGRPCWSLTCFLACCSAAEKKVGEYAKSKVGVTAEQNAFGLDADF